MLADADAWVTMNRRAGEVVITFGGDTNQAAQFTRSVPGFRSKEYSAATRLLFSGFSVRTGVRTTLRWREMDSNHRYPANFLAAPSIPPPSLQPMPNGLAPVRGGVRR